ncbi:VOC family protein, partial [bacterium]|nr:VOC family protein [bacterium]
MSDFNSQNNRAVWFDIPVADLSRAISFYSAVLGVEISTEKMGDFSFGVIYHRDGNGGCLVVNEKEISANSGILVYMNADGRIQDAAQKVEAQGGKIL